MKKSVFALIAVFIFSIGALAHGQEFKSKPVELKTNAQKPATSHESTFVMLSTEQIEKRSKIAVFQNDSARLMSDVQISALPPEEGLERIENLNKKYGNGVCFPSSNLVEYADNVLHNISWRLRLPGKAECEKDVKELKYFLKNPAIPSELKDKKVAEFGKKYHVYYFHDSKTSKKEPAYEMIAEAKTRYR